MKTIIGQPGAIEQPITYGWSPGRGFFTRRKWLCPTQSAARLLAQQLTGAKYSWTSTEGATVVVEGEINRDDVSGGGNENPEVPTERWELSTTTIQKDILDADVYAGWSGARPSDSQIQELSEYFKGRTTTRPTFTAGTLAALILAHHESGVSSVTIHQPVLRYQSTFSDSYSVQFALTRAGKVITTAGLTATEGLPATLKFGLPSETGNVTKKGIVCTYGWLKSYPSVQQAGDDKWNITQEYQFGCWSTTLYTFA